MPSRGCGAVNARCSKAKWNAAHILIFTLVAQALEECCPKFGTFALFKRPGERCRNFDIYFHGFGIPWNTQKHSNSHQNPPQIDRKSLKVGTWDGSGHPWAPSGALLGTTWGTDTKNHKKSELVDHPQGVPKEHIFKYVPILFRVLFLIPVSAAFPTDLGKEMTPESEVGCAEDIVNTVVLVRFHFFTRFFNN